MELVEILNEIDTIRFARIKQARYIAGTIHNHVFERGDELRKDDQVKVMYEVANNAPAMDILLHYLHLMDDELEKLANAVEEVVDAARLAEKTATPMPGKKVPA